MTTPLEPTPRRTPPPAPFQNPGRHFLEPIGKILPTVALTEVRPSPKLWTQAALTGQVAAATLRITDAAGQPVNQQQAFDHKKNQLVIVVGQPVRLKAQTNPIHPISDVQWTISGQSVYASTRQTPQEGTAVPMDGHLSAPRVDFHWIDGGDKTVTVTATVGGQRRSASLQCNVIAPTVKECSITTSTVNRFFPGEFKRIAGAVLALAAGDIPGCQRIAAASAPSWGSGDNAIGAGQFGFIQLINTVTAVKQTESGGYKVMTALDEAEIFVLDAGGQGRNKLLVGEGNGSQAAAGGAIDIRGPANTDSPAIELLDVISYAMMWSQFKLYFVYRSAIPGSIWITLRKFNWKFAGATTRAENGTWPAPADKFNVRPTPGELTAGANSIELPTWQQSTPFGIANLNQEEFNRVVAILANE
jgi:hypothetical protein